jgi:mRNA-degrading endonuclease YafQ of YafQ-DinJ toxin-antitoxin module
LLSRGHPQPAGAVLTKTHLPLDRLIYIKRRRDAGWRRLRSRILRRAVGRPPSLGWRVHQLSGDRAGTWSIAVSGNWRITFDLKDQEICNLNLEDYH